MASCYILVSQKLNRFYIGATNETVEKRLHQHLHEQINRKAFTAKAKDWIIFLTIPCDDFGHAARVERFLKRMKSKQFIARLKSEPGLKESVMVKCRIPNT